MPEGIEIDRFEDYIDEVILIRGANYAKGEAVKILKKTRRKVVAECEGTELYLVKLGIDGNQLLTYECTCPFEYGPICKHITAVLYIIRDGLDLEENKSSESVLSKESQSTSIITQVIEDLNEADLRELVTRWTNLYLKLERETVEYYREKLLNRK